MRSNSKWIRRYGERPTGCLPRVSEPGTLKGVPLAAEKLMDVIARDQWNDRLAEIPGGVVDMEDCLGEFYDQDGFGSCAWESTTKAIEAVCRLAGMTTSKLNPWFGYGIATNWRNGPTTGTNIDSNLTQAMSLGVASEEIWPRSMGTKKKPSTEAYIDAKRYRIIEAWDCVNVEEVATCILKRYPVVIGWNGHSEVLIGLKPNGIVKVAGSYGSTYYDGKGWHDEDIDDIDFGYGAFAVRAVVDRKLVTGQETITDSVLIEAARKYNGVRFHEGKRDPLLVELAEAGAKLLADRDEAGYWSNGAPAHPSWDERFSRIRKELGMAGVEVTAMARPGEGDDIGREVFYDWQRSSGHWNVVANPHARYGEALAKSASGIWFACVIVAD